MCEGGGGGGGGGARDEDKERHTLVHLTLSTDTYNTCIMFKMCWLAVVAYAYGKDCTGDMYAAARTLAPEPRYYVVERAKTKQNYNLTQHGWLRRFGVFG